MTGGPSWFVAFPVDGAFLSRVAPPPAGLRGLHADDLHLTVAFLGACGEERAHQALAVLDRLLAQRPIAPITVSLGEVVPMGKPHAYSALSVLLVEGREAVAATLGELRDPLADAASAPRETRAPKPHVTLARPARRASDAQRADGLAWARSLELGDVRLGLDRLALYTGANERAERRYRVVAERALGEASRVRGEEAGSRSEQRSARGADHIAHTAVASAPPSRGDTEIEGTRRRARSSSPSE